MGEEEAKQVLVKDKAGDSGENLINDNLLKEI